MAGWKESLSGGVVLCHFENDATDEHEHTEHETAANTNYESDDPIVGDYSIKFSSGTGTYACWEHDCGSTFTAQCYFRPSESQSGRLQIMAGSQSGTGGAGYPSWEWEATNSTTHWVYTQGESARNEVYFTYTMTPGTLYHCVMVASPSGLWAYVNGRLMGSNSETNFTTKNTSVHGVGAVHGYDDTVPTWQGAYDEYRLSASDPGDYPDRWGFWTYKLGGIKPGKINGLPVGDINKVNACPDVP